MTNGWPRRGDKARILVITTKSQTPVAAGPDGVEQLVFRAPSEVPGGAPRRFLGVVEDQPYFTVTVEPDGAEWRTLREFGLTIDELGGALVTSRSRSSSGISGTRTARCAARPPSRLRPAGPASARATAPTTSRAPIPR